ncbi:GTP-binding protein [Clostridium sp.]|uniref:GTP-binding protein n=1 Tax=Clostridium sp. TaxID=1506 RepID=UPI00261C0C6F|nr:GTP-binding protein [Clostridium sp.]
MKINIEIVTGFLGAGKTSFINSLLSESQVEGEKVLILQLENGEKKVQLNNNLVQVQCVNEVSDLREELIYSIKEYNPNRILIEYNGTSDLKDLFNILNDKIYRSCSKVTTIYFVADGKKLKPHIDNIGNFIIPFIQAANMVVVNNIAYCNAETLNEGIKRVKRINPRAYILEVNNKYALKSALKKSNVIDNGYLKKLRIKMSNLKRNK